ncbi:MAG: hypothetical protein NUV80_00830 [Candidatus Berkelbacteria bacterium]|nr:hypothetical protein [Candidatus Berkelbacteria bacterium]
MKKYKLLTKESIEHFGVTLYRIEAVTDFGIVRKGEKGGFIEKEENLSQEGNAWVYGNALVYGNARVYGNALVYGNAWVSGNALVYGNAWVSGNAWISKKIKLTGGYFYHTKRKLESMDTIETTDDTDYETLCREPKTESFEEEVKPVGKKVKIRIDGGQILEGEVVEE